MYFTILIFPKPNQLHNSFLTHISTRSLSYSTRQHSSSNNSYQVNSLASHIQNGIRFALAELLARRAGSKVDWLTIDEGFGSQSDEFLPMVIDAVKQVASRFGVVLVISHVKAVQEAFE